MFRGVYWSVSRNCGTQSALSLTPASTGVFFYVLFGVGASAAFFTTAAAKVEGYGALLNVGIAYGLGIVLAVVIAVGTSGGQLSPCYTLSFALFKGFPWRKVPFYIVSQVMGAAVAAWCVHACYKDAFHEITAAIRSAGPVAATDPHIFSPQGPAGVLALFPGAGQSFSALFITEFTANVVLAIVVFSALDGSNFVVSMSSGESKKAFVIASFRLLT
jgi:glycerol uptake facilitator-like aquaporin